jgi:hypothetical protein
VTRLHLSLVGGAIFWLAFAGGAAWEHYRPWGTAWAYRSISELAAEIGQP